MALLWFAVIVVTGITIWRFIVHDRNNKKKD